MRLIDADALEGPLELQRASYERIGATERAEAYANCLWEIAQAPTVGGWVSVKDRLPESGKHVLAACEIRFIYGGKKTYVCEALYAAQHTFTVGKYPEDDECFDYDEDEDEYYLKEGWYEAIHNWDEYSSVVIEDFVTHWMPLPEPPQEVSEDARLDHRPRY